ncbi:MAG: dihydroorotate dehydrogenase electron transfer subunit [Bacteroidales bacterium]|nr:dihydroorotate dehydrogenase electron transfer subunit [Bacteroidales bacterium]
MPKRIEDFKIVDNQRLNNDLFILELAGSSDLPELKPGQFVQAKVEGSPQTFLRRPFSIHDVDYARNTLKLLVQIAGRGTGVLSGLGKDDYLNLIYPLGNSFSLPGKEEKLLLVGGGCGVAPLLFLGKYLKSNGNSPDILLGFRNRARIIEEAEYAKIGRVYLTTEDGSEGEKGLVTDHPVLSESEYDRIFCCGPDAMMRAVAGYAATRGIECEVSLENLMACGIGACLCCVVATVNGNQCTCIDGPVFNINDLKW